MPEVKNYRTGHHYADGKTPGRYVCRTEFSFNGVPYVLEHECNNPEIGRRILFERETDIIDPLARPKRRKAV